MALENTLLAALSDGERRRLEPFFETVRLETHQVLVTQGRPIDAVYFPRDCLASCVQVMENGTMIETGIVGHEGIVGVPLWLHMPSTSTRTFVQVAGEAVRMSAEDFAREVMGRPSPLDVLVARYTHGYLTMASQVAACNRLHTIDARLCRWLALTHDRIRRDDFDMRQEFLAEMLGVQRPTVSIAASMLQKAGLIRYSRGRMRILDAAGLRAGSCECLDLIEREFARAFAVPAREPGSHAVL